MIVFFCDHQSRIAGSGTWLTLSQRVMGSKREAKYSVYFVTKSSGFEKGSEELGLLCHKE